MEYPKRELMEVLFADQLEFVGKALIDMRQNPISNQILSQQNKSHSYGAGNLYPEEIQSWGSKTVYNNINSHQFENVKAAGYNNLSTTPQVLSSSVPPKKSSSPSVILSRPEASDFFDPFNHTQQNNFSTSTSSVLSRLNSYHPPTIWDDSKKSHNRLAGGATVWG
ncbi:uncharacterized protein PRCAT00003291001 [Priceomyces carsonii]|uniref:uncharacterized protein n=1 Tax=Priceomyces carsonii TaxID=28549 RepID=UPI002EDAC055|nr:unnamed protein product [Priceomyces carsonii]